MNEGDAAVNRQSTGIAGLDDLLQGGLAHRRLTLLYGGTGTGKTVLALQILAHNARAGMPGIFLGFEESPDELIENHASFGWNVAELAGDTLHLMAAPVDDEFSGVGQFDIAGLLAGLEAKISQTGARWVLIDGLDVLLGALDDRVTAMRELLRLKRWLAEHDVSILLTAKLDASEPVGVAHFRDMPYVADCVIALDNRVQKRTFSRTLRVIKNRGAHSSSARVPFVITERGIAVAQRRTRRLSYQISAERLTSGISRLDTLLDGGYCRGSSVLISGAPGTAKTTLSVCFAAAMAARGERVLYISFDECADQIATNMRSIGLDLKQHVDSGLLCIVGIFAASASAERHYIDIEQRVAEFEPAHLVVDPISALGKAGGREMAAEMIERVLDMTKARFLTLVMTSLVEHSSMLHEITESHVSTIADAWISLSYNVNAGERNRGLTIIKSRGTAHSNQVRELVLTGDGPQLADVYIAGGKVLMGSARSNKEQEVEAERERDIECFERERSRVATEMDDTGERIATLQQRLERQREYMQQLNRQEQARNVRRRDHDARPLRSRGADENDPRLSREDR